MPRSRRPRRRKASRPPRALQRFGLLFGQIPAEVRQPMIPPEIRNRWEAIQGLMDRIPRTGPDGHANPIREGLEKFPYDSVPYVLRAHIDAQLDSPRTTPGLERQLQRARNEVNDVIKKLKAGPRPRGFPAAPPLGQEKLGKLAAEYVERAARSKGGPEIWRAMAEKHRYPNWKEMRTQVTEYRKAAAHLRSL